MKRLKGSKEIETFLMGLKFLENFSDIRFYMSEYLIKYTLKTAFDDDQVSKSTDGHQKDLADSVLNKLADALCEYNYKEIQEFIDGKSRHLTHNCFNFIKSYMQICFEKDFKNDPKNFFDCLPIKGRENRSNGSRKLENIIRELEYYQEYLKIFFYQSGENIKKRLILALQEGQEKKLKNDFKDNCLADFVANEIAEWIKETIINNFPKEKQEFFYPPILTKKLNYDCRKIKQEKRFIMYFIYFITEQGLIKNEKAKEHLLQGVGRRLKHLSRCVDNIYNIWPLNKPLISDEERTDVEINLKSFIIDCDALLDNLAHIWKEESNNSTVRKFSKHNIGLRKSCKKMRKLFSKDFQKKLEHFDSWFDFLKYRRDFLVHTIPPYIPPFVIDPNDKQKFRLLCEKQENLEIGDIESYNAITEEIKSYQRSIPLMAHSYIEGMKPYYFHKQIIIDWKTIVNIFEDFFEELKGEHYPFHLIKYSKGVA